MPQEDFPEAVHEVMLPFLRGDTDTWDAKQQAALKASGARAWQEDLGGWGWGWGSGVEACRCAPHSLQGIVAFMAFMWHGIHSWPDDSWQGGVYIHPVEAPRLPPDPSSPPPPPPPAMRWCVPVTAPFTPCPPPMQMTKKGVSLA